MNLRIERTTGMVDGNPVCHLVAYDVDGHLVIVVPAYPMRGASHWWTGQPNAAERRFVMQAIARKEGVVSGPDIVVSLYDGVLAGIYTTEATSKLRILVIEATAKETRYPPTPAEDFLWFTRIHPPEPMDSMGEQDEGKIAEWLAECRELENGGGT